MVYICPYIVKIVLINLRSLDELCAEDYFNVFTHSIFWLKRMVIRLTVKIPLNL